MEEQEKKPETLAELSFEQLILLGAYIAGASELVDPELERREKENL